jgi:hypothetical protein
LVQFDELAEISMLFRSEAGGGVLTSASGYAYTYADFADAPTDAAERRADELPLTDPGTVIVRLNVPVVVVGTVDPTLLPPVHAVRQAAATMAAPMTG